MQAIPKIVRERLKAATPAVNHPDADALTAFAERSLPEVERAVVLEHLARCGECRDAVALALPASEPVPTAVRPSPRGWPTWPALRWGFVAAGIVGIAWFGVLQFQRSRQPETIASKSSAPLEVAANEPKKQSLDQFAAAPAEQRDKVQSPSLLRDSIDKESATGDENKAKAFPVVPAAPVQQVGRASGGAAYGAQLPHGPRLPNQQQQLNSFQYPAPAPPQPSALAKQQDAPQPSANRNVPASSEMVEVEGAPGRLETQAQSLDGRQVRDLQAAQQSAGDESASAHVGKAKPAATPSVAYGTAAMPESPALTQATGGAVPASAAPLPRWSISPSGGLQRSFDQGNTWQNVDVNVNSASYMSATSLEVGGKTSRAKVKDSVPAPKRETAPPTFRTVAAAGAEVWAGGSALYHSQDAGNHWTRVVPAGAGATLTGDIVSLEFPDPQHGKVSTSTAEVWTTADNGQTWQRR